MTKPREISADQFRREQGLPVKPRMPQTVAEFSVVIPMELPTWNELINVKASRWKGRYNKVKQDCDARIAGYWRNQGACKIIGRYRTRWELTFADKRTDPDNHYGAATKLILDALVNAGAIENDSCKYHLPPVTYSWTFGEIEAVKVTVTAEGDNF